MTQTSAPGPRTYVTRLSTSLTREERTSLRRRFGASHVSRAMRHPGPWDTMTCDCHGLRWATTDVRGDYGTARPRYTCPLAR